MTATWSLRLVIQFRCSANVGAARVRATVSRLRTTWIVAQIDNGLPLQVLKTIGGFTSASGLDMHLAYAKTPNMDDYIGLIIGEEVPR